METNHVKSLRTLAISHLRKYLLANRNFVFSRNALFKLLFDKNFVRSIAQPHAIVT